MGLLVTLRTKLISLVILLLLFLTTLVILVSVNINQDRKIIVLRYKPPPVVTSISDTILSINDKIYLFYTNQVDCSLCDCTTPEPCYVNLTVVLDRELNPLY